ncbi:uncharacterized protein CC84DRAFT_1216077 [Paraphaeosphaeria sporulosa]|uniref:Ecp2 effector protein domain-containing protein n=1 Tax=Paraphaeosphaeria sporulosa TaxID=1460663 RepID=A0A177CHM9_9PLEO|nr:uncharacterized protein CC84DRAFT_1216077 [Paraphaeosphaeria sporulosa]OAG07073.1 hypothetical protein CC84DRAFT_1216077 [Paraphaeosphaeria sporulosa]
MLFSVLLLLTSSSALPSPNFPNPPGVPGLLFASRIEASNLPPDPWTGTRLITEASNRSWPNGACGPGDAYSALDAVRQCAISLVSEIPHWRCPCSDRLDGPGVYHCMIMDGGEPAAVVKSWSGTNKSQSATCGEVGQAVIWVLDNCSRNDRQDTAGWKSVPGNENHLVGVTNWR